jgi:hypothetical protein
MTNNTMQPHDKIPASVTSSVTIDIARKNSRLAAIAATLATSLSLAAIVVTIVIDVNYGKVAAVPVGRLWDLPAVNRIYVPNRVEEDAKPIHVALRYIRNFYEVDLTDFVQIGSDIATTGGPVMISTRATQLLPYTLPGTTEYKNALKVIDYSTINYRLFNESKCWRRFLIDSVEMQDSVSGTKRVDALGKFIIACDDTTKPIPSENLGLKLITVYLTKRIPTMMKQRSADAVAAADPRPEDLQNISFGDAETTALNPEGWFVVKNKAVAIDGDEYQRITESRRLQNSRPAR